MGRPPCCDKVGVKKGPWTPEEDIMLVSYVQQHGPGNWRAVPTNTELRRCSKSCRLRWTNYLRPGIRRGSFTDQEEKQIIQLQALLGNKWAAIASYLPERTDNDIKNYWNTHLRKKIKSHQDQDHDDQPKVESSITKGQWEKRLQTDIHKAKRALHDALSLDNTIPIPELNPSSGNSYFSSKSPIQTSSTYVSSTDNIARMLKGWMKNCPKEEQSQSSITDQCSFNKTDSPSSTEEGTPIERKKSGGIDLSEAFDSLFGFDSGSDFCQGESKPDILGGKSSFTMLEEWFLGEVNIHEDKEDLPNFSFDGNAPTF